MPLSLSYTIILQAILISFLWGCTPIFVKHCKDSLHYSTIFVLAGSFLAILTLFIFLYNRTTIMADLSKNIEYKHVAAILAFATLGLCIGNYLYINLVSKHGTIITAISYTAPIFTIVLAYLILNESLNVLQLIGVALGVIGVSLVICGK